MRVTLAQLRSHPSKEYNLRRAEEVVKEAEGELVLFPEYYMGYPEGGFTAEYLHEVSEGLDGRFIGGMVRLSHEYGVSIGFGAFLRGDNGVYNALILASEGDVKAVYRKIHLFDAYGYSESSLFKPGSEVVVTRIGGWAFGLAVCFDLRFPELFRRMALEGAEAFLVSSAWYEGGHKLDQWLLLTGARAHENTAFMVAVNQAAKPFTGYSTVVDPFGNRLVSLGVGERVITVRLDKSLVSDARRLVPVLKMRRPEVYGQGGFRE